jgi:hypothetical protein
MEKIEKEKAEKIRKKQSPSPHTALDKCKAVLSVWSERRKPSEICRELSIQWSILEHWQNRAMEGMLQALEPRINLERGPALSPRLASLIEKRCALRASPDRLDARLAKVQQGRNVRKEEPVMQEAN